MRTPDIDVIERKDVPLEASWNAESVYASVAEWESELASISDELPAISAMAGTLEQSATRLLEAIRAVERIQQRNMKAFTYASMAFSVDTNDQAAGSMESMAMGLAARVSAAVSFLEPEILAMGQDRIAKWLESESGLAPYAHYFENLFRLGKHIRSSEVEELISALGDSFNTCQTIWTVLAGAEMTFRPSVGARGQALPVFPGNIDALLSCPDRETRRLAWESYADSFLGLRNTLGASLLGSVKQDLFRMRARGYDSCLRSALYEHNIPVEIFHNLIAAFREHLPIWHRYWEVRRKALKVEKLFPYDIWAPLSASSPRVPYAQAVEWIAEGMAPLGREYVDALERGCGPERWVDYLPNRGKRPGAFSSGSKGTHPFIMQSYNEDLHSLSTLAHELGHSLHSYFTWRNQPVLYSNYSIFAAEVASNFNQAMVRAHLLKSGPSRDLELAILEEAMGNFHRYLFLMPTLARFELAVHEKVERGESPAASDLMELCVELFSEAYGGKMEIDRERVGITWAQFPHLYAAYYVFQYATGISGAHALAEKVLEGRPGAAERYIEFLSAGHSLYPLDALRRAGCDLSSPEPIRSTFRLLEGMIGRLEQLVSE